MRHASVRRKICVGRHASLSAGIFTKEEVSDDILSLPFYLRDACRRVVCERGKGDPFHTLPLLPMSSLVVPGRYKTVGERTRRALVTGQRKGEFVVDLIRPRVFDFLLSRTLRGRDQPAGCRCWAAN